MSATRTIYLAMVLAAGCQDVDAFDDVVDEQSADALAQETAVPTVRQPEYDANGRLIKPTDTDRWVFLGTGVNLNYVEGAAPGGSDFLTTTFMEPSAYQAYLATGGALEPTARNLFVHPNTVRYRLHRIADLTGRDPWEPRDLLAISTAVI